MQEAGWLPVVIEHVWNLKPILDDQSTVGSLLRVLVGYNDNPALLEAIGYLTYWIVVRGGQPVGESPRRDRIRCRSCLTIPQKDYCR